MKRSTKFLLVAALFLLLLPACTEDRIEDDEGIHGGGAHSEIPETMTVSGTAAKGIIIAGVVVASEVNESGFSIREIGRATTDSTGHYSITISDNYGGGVVKIVITPAESGTQMKCDVPFGCGDGVGFGTSMDLPGDFSMTAMIPEINQQTVNIQITPLTHMAAARAVSGGFVSSLTVARANSEIAQMVGVNIIDTQVVDITDNAAVSRASKASRQYTIFNSGIARVLHTGSSDLTTNLGKLAESFDDGRFSSAEIASLDMVGNIQSTIENIRSQHPELASGLRDEMQVVEAALDNVNAQTDENGYDPEPYEEIAGDDIARARALITSSRTFIKQIGDNFDSPVNALDADQQSIETVYNSDIVNMADLLGQVVAQTIEYFNTTTSLEEQLVSPGTHDIPIVNDLGANLGTLNAAVSMTGGLSITLNGAVTGASGITANITDLKLTTNLAKSDITIGEPGTKQAGWATALTSEDVQLGASGFIGNDNASLALEDVFLRVTASRRITYVFADPQNVMTHLTSVAFEGTVVIKAADVTFTGSTEIRLVGLDESKRTTPATSLSIKHLALSGEFNSPRGTFSASARLDIENAAAFDTFGFIGHDRYNYYYVNYTAFEETRFFSEKTQACLDTIGAGYSNSDLTSLSFYGNQTSLRINCSTSNGRWGTLSDINVSPEAVTALKNLLRSEANLTEGDIAEISLSYIYYYDYSHPDYNSTSGYLSYVADRGEFESADNFVKGMLSVTASATVPDIPSLTATLMVKREELNGGNASLTISHGGQTYTLSISSNNIMADNAAFTITLTNPDGVYVTFTNDDDQYDGSIFFGENRVGTIGTSQGLPIVRYSDGTMESLF